MIKVTFTNEELRAMGLAPAVVRGSRARRSRKSSRHSHNHHNIHPVQIDMKSISEQLGPDQHLFYGSNDIEDYISSQLIYRAFSNSQGFSRRRIKVSGDLQHWLTWASAQLSGGQIIEFGDRRGTIYLDDRMISWYAAGTLIEVEISGNAEFVPAAIDSLKANFNVAETFINWVFTPQGDSIRVQLDTSRLPIDEMYPWLDSGLESYYNKYLESDSSILILIGQPGTGKSTFIKGMIAHSSYSATVSYDEDVLTRDQFFADFIDSESNILVIEDADNFLQSRANGNNMMHRFLNVGDGLVSSGSKKIIFSTNLPSVKDIDSALTRPGRCFDIVDFRKLTQAEAARLAQREGKAEPKGKSEYSLAEVMNPEAQPIATVDQPRSHKFGFA